MVDYILIAIFAVIAAFVTKYLAPFLLYILKVPHKLVTVVNLLLYIGVFAGTFIALYLWPQPRVLADSAIAWGETTYQHVVSILPTRTPTSIPDKQTMTPTKMLVSTKTPAPTAITSSDPLVFSPSLSGVVVTDFGRLNLREGPGTDYPSLGMLETGDKVAIVQRNVAGDWFFVETKEDKSGWVAERYIEIENNLKQVSVTPNIASPSPTSQIQMSPTENSSLETFDVSNGQVYGTLDATSDKWYSFVNEDRTQSALLQLMFSPNVNLNGNRAQFFIYEEKHSSNWPPNWPDTIPNLGAGSSPPSDLDGDMGNGELLWKGELIGGARYYLRIVNSSPDSFSYCLVTKEVRNWICPH